MRASLSWLHCSHRGHVNNLEYYGNFLKRYIEARNDMRYVRTYVRTDGRTYTVRTDKLAIEHTSVGLAHACPTSACFRKVYVVSFVSCIIADTENGVARQVPVIQAYHTSSAEAREREII